MLRLIEVLIETQGVERFVEGVIAKDLKCSNRKDGEGRGEFVGKLYSKCNDPDIEEV